LSVLTRSDEGFHHFRVNEVAVGAPADKDICRTPSGYADGLGWRAGHNGVTIDGHRGPTEISIDDV